MPATTSYDEWEDAPATTGREGTRCRDCLHFFPCEFDDERDAADAIGDDAVRELIADFGMCEIDNPVIVSGDHQAFDRDGYECWEAR